MGIAVRLCAPQESLNSAPNDKARKEVGVYEIERPMMDWFEKFASCSLAQTFAKSGEREEIELGEILALVELCMKCEVEF